MKCSVGQAVICQGFNNHFKAPKDIGGMPVQFRTAVVIKKRDFFDEWEVYDALFWRITGRVSEEISDSIRISVFDCETKPFTTLSKLRAWQAQQQISDSEFVLEPPREIEFFSENKPVCLMELEDWSDIGKPEPYACSFTFSFYCSSIITNAKVKDAINEQLTKDPEISGITTEFESKAPRWYWPIINTIKSTKFFIFGMLGLMALATAFVVFISPSPSMYNKIVQCRQSLQKARSVLLDVDNSGGGITFTEWREVNGTERELKDIAAQICAYCEEYSRMTGRKMFRIQNYDGRNLLTDPWGQPYNVNTLSSFHSATIRNGLNNYTVEGIVMWSSGPNGINENGEGDDIFELARNQWGN